MMVVHTTTQTASARIVGAPWLPMAATISVMKPVSGTTMRTVPTRADFDGPVRSSGTQLNYQNCPVCGSAGWKVYLNPDTGMWYCHAGQHSGGGAVDVGMPSDPAAALREKLRGYERATTHWPEIAMPPHGMLSNAARRYLEDRGFAHSLHMFWELDDESRILVPYRGPNGEWIYWNSRMYLLNYQGPKYKCASGRHPLYVLPRWEPHDNVVLVEGVMDAMAVRYVMGHCCGVIALGGKSLPQYLVPDLLKLAPKSITVMLDSDALAHAISLRSRLSPIRDVKLCTLPAGKDPASMDHQQLRRLLDG